METSHELIKSDIFLSIKLNKSLQELLIKVHHYFRDENKAKLKEDKRLRELFSIILDCPVLRDNIVWFNDWLRESTGNYKIHFIKDSNKISKTIINISKEKEYVDYVSSLSALAKDYNYKKPGSNKRQFPIDYSYLISTENSTKCNIEMTSQYIKGFFVYLNFEKVKELFKDFKFNEHHNNIGKIALNEKKKEIIKILKNNYDYLAAHADINEIIDGLTVQLSHGWGFGSELKTKINNNKITVTKDNTLDYSKHKHKDNIIKLINYFFWTKLAYPEEWKVLLYLPGVIAKEYGGVPLGVNIGLKEMVSLEVILFLKRAVLLFYTRKSVDFFANLAKEESKKRIREVGSLVKLLSDFQHTILQSILDSAKYLLQSTNPLCNNILSYISQRGTYLHSLAQYLNDTSNRDTSVSPEELNAKGLEEQLQDRPIFINKISSFDYNVVERISKWKDLFIIRNIPQEQTINVTGICWGPIQTIIENLIKNSIDEGGVESKKGKIYIIFTKVVSEYPSIIYFDTGKGFAEKSLGNIPSWYSEEHPVGKKKGYGYWLIGRIMDHVGGELKLVIFNKGGNLRNLNDTDGSLNPDSSMSHKITQILCELNIGFPEFYQRENNLENGNFMVIHILIFKKQYWNQSYEINI